MSSSPGPMRSGHRAKTGFRCVRITPWDPVVPEVYMIVATSPAQPVETGRMLQTEAETSYRRGLYQAIPRRTFSENSSAACCQRGPTYQLPGIRRKYSSLHRRITELLNGLGGYRPSRRHNQESRAMLIRTALGEGHGLPAFSNDRTGGQSIHALPELAPVMLCHSLLSLKRRTTRPSA